MAKRVRFGIIGLGVIGAYHAKAITALKGDAELVAVADRVPDRSEQYAREYGVRGYQDHRSLLADPEVDAVSICTPSGLHAPLAIDALRAGKHVLCEKPLDITLEAIDRIIAVQQESGRLLAGMFQRRFARPIQAVQQAVANGSLGRLTYASAEMPFWRSQSYYDSGDWRGTWALDGGGCLMNQGIHTIDLLQWLMGPVAEVTAYTGTLAHDRIEVEDVATAAVRFESGALGVIGGTTAVYPGLPTRVTIGGTLGSAVIRDNDLDWFHVRQQGLEAGAYGGLADGNQAGALLAEIGPDRIQGDQVVPGAELQQRVILDLIEAVRGGRDPLVTGREARKAVAVILAIYESARTGKTVRVS